MSLVPTARELARQLAQQQLRVVFAESCTAGLASASLARIAGVSQWHCGSAVTYRDRTKVAWLGVEAADLHKYTAVSRQVAGQMALGVLAKTAEADVAASVTGHLGPDAPAKLDGVVFIGVARRKGRRPELIRVRRFRLEQQSRHQRQREAAELVLKCLVQLLG